MLRALTGGLLAAALLLLSPAPLRAQPAPSAERKPFDTRITETKSMMMADPEQALVRAREAVAEAGKLPSARDRALAEAEGQWLEGEALTRVNQPELARPVIAGALATVIRLAPRSKLHGDLLIASAAADSVTGQVQSALSQFLAAHDIFAALGEARSRAKALQYIGSIYFDARDYPRMMRYYQQSAEAFQGDPSLTISAYNNIGDALKEMKRYSEAEANYEKALDVARQIDSPVLEVRILTNLAGAAAAGGELGRADAAASRGLARARGHDTGWEPFLWGVKAQIALARRDLDAASVYIDRTFAGADLATTTRTFRDFHQTAYQLYTARGDLARALAHLAAFKRVDDEGRDVAASTNSALMSARFDFANQELKIAQRDIELTQSRARFLYVALGAAAIIALGSLVALLQIRRSRNQVRAANVTLSALNTDLEAALSAKTRFLAATSHEIRTPLNGILGMTQVMLSDRELEPRQRERVRLVFDAGETMKALVDDILDVAKMENGGVVIDRAEFDLRAMLDNVAKLWKDQAAAKGLRVTATLDRCPKRIVEDARRFRQIVFNLMSNAVKFTESGLVELSARVEDDRLVLTVSDTGIGIPADQFEAIFASFHQVDAETTRRYGGSGLGLAICRDLAEALGGTIEVASELGKGSTFTVRLPLQLPATAVADEAEDDGGWPPRTQQATLLVVENNPLTRGVILAAFKPHFAAVDAVDGDAAAAALRDGRYHHVLGDLAALGGWAGLDALAGSDMVSHLLAFTVLAPAGEVVDSTVTARHPALQVIHRPVKPADLVISVTLLHARMAGVEANAEHAAA